jgi:aryl-alcohol dehydrogenase-like predicted oxidoreductase
MQLVPFGKTGLLVSPLCIGTWQLAGPLWFDGVPDGHPDPGRDNVLNMIAALADRGINFIDTAEQYGGGEAERRTGAAIAGSRDKWIVSTKFGYRVGPGNTRIDDSSPGTIASSIEGSLQRLGTDYIDIYLYHCAPTAAELPEAARVLDRARQAGKIRYIGISGADLSIIEALHAGGLLDVVQYPTSLLEPRDDIREFCVKHNVGTQLRGIMAHGRLSGKYLAGQQTWHRDDSRNHRVGSEDLSRYATLQALLPAGYTLAQAAVRWTLDQPGHHTICMGAKNLPDYESAIAALELPPLGDEVVGKLEAKAAELAGAG